MVQSESRATDLISSEGNGKSTGLSVGVGVIKADMQTSEEAVVGTCLEKMPLRCACLAERGLEAECLLDDMTIIFYIRVVIFILL